MSKNADFSQLEQFLKNNIKAFEEFPSWIEKFFLREANRALDKIIERHNEVYAATGKTVDTRAMLLSWYVSYVRRVGNDLEVTLGNPQDYSSFIEFGARNVNGSWRDGYFIMTIPIDRIQRQLPERFNRDFKAYLQSKGAT